MTFILGNLGKSWNLKGSHGQSHIFHCHMGSMDLGQKYLEHLQQSCPTSERVMIGNDNNNLTQSKAKVIIVA